MTNSFQKCTICNSDTEVTTRIYWFDNGIGSGVYDEPLNAFVWVKINKWFLSKLPAKYSDKKDKINSLISEYEKLDNELCEPIRQKVEENIRQFFKKKDKAIPLPEFDSNKRCSFFSLCKSCYSELPYPSETEMKRIEEKIKIKSEEFKQANSEMDFRDFGLSENEVAKEQERILKEEIISRVKELNSKIIAEREREREREREQKWEEYRLKTLNYRC